MRPEKKKHAKSDQEVKAYVEKLHEKNAKSVADAEKRKKAKAAAERDKFDSRDRDDRDGPTDSQCYSQGYVPEWIRRMG